MSSPGSGTPGTTTGAVGGVNSSGVPDTEKPTPTVAQQNINQANAFRPKGTPAREINPSTGNVEVVGGGQTADQLKAEAEQQNIKELGFTPGAQFPSQAEINQKVANLGINYESQTPNLVNGVLTSGQPSPRDLYVQTLLTEVATGYKGQGFSSSEDYLSNRLQQVGLAYNPQTKTITDPLLKGIIQQQLENQTKGGYAGLSSSEAGPQTSLSEKLGSSFGQKGLGYVPAVSPEGYLNYGPAQIASLISSVKNNPEYGGNQNFLVGDIGTENSKGSLEALNLNQSHNTDIPSSIINQETNHNKTISLSETLGISEGIAGGSNQKSISKTADIFSPEQLKQLLLQNNLNARANNAIDKLANEQSINDFISSAKSSGAKTIDIFQENTDIASVFPAHETGFENIPLSISALSAKSSKLNLLESVPISKAKDVLTSLSEKNNQGNIFFSYNPAPKALPQIGATLGFEIVSPAEKAVGSLISSVQKIEKENPYNMFGYLAGQAESVLNIGGTILNAKTILENLNTGNNKSLIQTGYDPSQYPFDILISAIKNAGKPSVKEANDNFLTALKENGPAAMSGKAGFDIATMAEGGVGLASAASRSIKSVIGQQARTAAILFSGKGSNVFVTGAKASNEITLAESSSLRSLPTYKNLNMMRTSLPTDIFGLDTATATRGLVSASPKIPLNTTLENTASQIEQLRQTTSDLLKPSSIQPLSNKSVPVQEDVLFINKVPFKSLGSNNGVGKQIKAVDTNAVLGTGTTPPEDLTGSTAPIKKTLPSTAQVSTSSSSGLVPGSGVPGSVGIAGAVGGQSSAGVPDIFQQSLASRVDFERRLSERANPDLFESGFVPYSSEIISPSLRSTEIGQRLEALDLFKKGIAAKKNASYYTREGVPKELMGKFSKLISNQTVGARPEIFGTKPVKLKLEDIEYNPAEHYQAPLPRTGRSPFDIQFGEIALFSKQEFTSNLLSPEEQALAERRYPLMKNTLPNNLNPFNEPRTTPQTGKAPIQKDTFNISETVKGREEAKFFGTFELKTGFEEIGYIPRNENPIFVKTIPSGQRIESLDLFKTGIKAKLNPDYYQRIGVPKELMGKFSKEIGQQTTGNKLPEIFGEKAENIIKESNLDAFYSPQENIRQFFERLESNKPNVHNNSNLKGYGIERLELNITKNKTKINTDKLLGIDTEEPAIGESKSRLEDIIKGGLNRDQRESRLTKLIQNNEEDVFSNARSFFQNVKEQTPFVNSEIPIEKGEFHTLTGKRERILNDPFYFLNEKDHGGKGSDFGGLFTRPPPRKPPGTPEVPKDNTGELIGRNGLVQIVKEQVKTEKLKQQIKPKQEELTKAEELVKTRKKKTLNTSISSILTSIRTTQETKQEQKEKQSQSLIFEPIQTFKQIQDLLNKQEQKQKQPQASIQISLQEQSPALSQLFKPIQAQKQKQPQLTRQLEENPFPNISPQKQIQELLQQIPQIPPTHPPKEPPIPPFGLPDDHKRYPKKKKAKGKLFNYIGNVPEFDIVGVFKRTEITYGQKTINRLTAQDRLNSSKSYANKINNAKAQNLFAKGNNIKVKSGTAKPKPFQTKYNKKLKF